MNMKHSELVLDLAPPIEIYDSGHLKKLNEERGKTLSIAFLELADTPFSIQPNHKERLPSLGKMNESLLVMLRETQNGRPPDRLRETHVFNLCQFDVTV
jgi:hypothetical protein